MYYFLIMFFARRQLGVAEQSRTIRRTENKVSLPATGPHRPAAPGIEQHVSLPIRSYSGKACYFSVLYLELSILLLPRRGRLSLSIGSYASKACVSVFFINMIYFESSILLPLHVLLNNACQFQSDHTQERLCIVAFFFNNLVAYFANIFFFACSDATCLLHKRSAM